MGTALAGAGISSLVFVLYLGTLAPTVLPYELPELADAPMLQMQACTLSMTHPTGYPTYLMLTHLFTYLPFGDCAYRVNLASAVYAALAVSAVYTVGFLMSRRVAAAAAGALAFGVGATFWSQAVIAEVYTLNALFIALTLVALLLWQDRRRNVYLLLAALGAGLSATNHMTSALLLPAGLLFVAVVDRRRLADAKLMLGAAGAFLLGLAPYLYLPIRAPSAPMKTNNPDNLERFWWMVSGGDLRGGFFAFGPAELPGRLLFYGGWLLDNFGWFLLAAGMVGFAAMVLWDRARAALTGFLFLGWGFHAVENDIVDVELYFIPTYLILALWISYGLKVLLEEAEAILSGIPRARVAVLPLLSIALVLLPLPGVAQTRAENDMSGDYRARRIIDSVADNAAPGATVLHLRSSLWYMVLVEQRRRDLTLVDPFQNDGASHYNDVVWPGDIDLRTKKLHYGIGDDTGVTAARKAAERGPVYLLAHEGLDPRPFQDAGFRIVHVEGTFYELLPPKSRPDKGEAS